MDDYEPLGMKVAVDRIHAAQSGLTMDEPDGDGREDPGEAPESGPTVERAWPFRNRISCESGPWSYSFAVWGSMRRAMRLAVERMAFVQGLERHDQIPPRDLAP